jgi:hypothetical protein
MFARFDRIAHTFTSALGLVQRTKSWLGAAVSSELRVEWVLLSRCLRPVPVRASPHWITSVLCVGLQARSLARDNSLDTPLDRSDSRVAHEPRRSRVCMLADLGDGKSRPHQRFVTSLSVCSMTEECARPARSSGSNSAAMSCNGRLGRVQDGLSSFPPELTPDQSAVEHVPDIIDVVFYAPGADWLSAATHDAATAPAVNFSAHAQDRMLERGLSEHEVKLTVAHGSKVPLPAGCWRFERNEVVVIASAEQSDLTVITTWSAAPRESANDLLQFTDDRPAASAGSSSDLCPTQAPGVAAARQDRRDHLAEAVAKVDQAVRTPKAKAPPPDPPGTRWTYSPGITAGPRQEIKILPSLSFSNIPGNFSFERRAANYMHESAYRRIGDAWVFIPWRWLERSDNWEEVRKYSPEEQRAASAAIVGGIYYDGAATAAPLQASSGLAEPQLGSHHTEQSSASGIPQYNS